MTVKQQWTATCLDCGWTGWGASYDALQKDIGWHEAAEPTHIVHEHDPLPWNG